PPRPHHAGDGTGELAPGAGELLAAVAVRDRQRERQRRSRDHDEDRELWRRPGEAHEPGDLPGRATPARAPRSGPRTRPDQSATDVVAGTDIADGAARRH